MATPRPWLRASPGALRRAGSKLPGSLAGRFDQSVKSGDGRACSLRFFFFSSSFYFSVGGEEEEEEDEEGVLSLAKVPATLPACFRVGETV